MGHAPGEVDRGATDRVGVAKGGEAEQASGEAAGEQEARCHTSHPTPPHTPCHTKPHPPAPPLPPGALSPTATLCWRNRSSTSRISRDTSPHLPTASAEGGWLRRTEGGGFAIGPRAFLELGGLLTGVEGVSEAVLEEWGAMGVVVERRG